MRVDLVQAPAIQLQEHAKAILKDDKALGVVRSDPFVKRLARGDPTHSVPRLHVNATVLPIQAREAFRALDEAAMRVNLKISKVDLGQQKGHPMLLPTDFIVAMDSCPSPRFFPDAKPGEAALLGSTSTGP